MNKFQKGDYVLVNYDGEMLTGKILRFNEKNTNAEVEVCLSSRRGEKLLTDVVSVDVNSLQELGIVKN